MSITGTLIVQMIVFLILVGFTMKFVWPPITAALDERAKKIADGPAKPVPWRLPEGAPRGTRGLDRKFAPCFPHRD